MPTSQVTVGKKFHMTQRLLKRNGRRGGNDKVDDISAMAAANNTTSPTDDDWDGNIVISDMEEREQDVTLSAAKADGSKSKSKNAITESHLIIGKDHQLEK